MSDRNVTVRLRGDIADFQRKWRTAGNETDVFTRKLEAADRRGGKAIDSLSGRVSLLGDALLTLGPGLIPLASVGVPAVAALSSSLGFAVVAAGSAALAFGGVGEALEKLNKAHLDPTEANLAEVEKALERLSPAAQDFVEKLGSLRGLVGDLREAGSEELFPGLVDALDSLESRGPDVERIIRSVNSALGDIAADAGESLAGPRWDDFFDFLADEAPEILDSTADSLGSITHGLAELWMAVAPLSEDGLDWIEGAAKTFDEWATNLDKTKGFQAFVDYIRENGPQVQDTLQSVADAAIAIVEAAAPLGGPALRSIESFADIVARIADSDFATPLLAAVGAMRAINRLAPGAGAGMLLMAGGGAGGKGGKGGKPGKGRGGSGIGVAPWQVAGAIFAADMLTQQLGWEKATDRQIAKAEEFTEKWGAALSDQAEKARVKLTELLDISTGKGPFGLLENDTGLTDAFLNAPLEKQLALRKQLREEYGVGLKQLEDEGILLEGTTRHFEHQREAVDFWGQEIERIGNLKATPKLDFDDSAARSKGRDADGWIDRWGNRRESALVDLLDPSRRKKSKEADDWIANWDKRRGKAKADVDGRRALATLLGLDSELLAFDRKKGTAKAEVDGRAAMSLLLGIGNELDALDGKTATTYVNTVRTVTGRHGAAATSVEAYGDVKNAHQPEIAAGGEWRVWAEPETMGESYIPHANDSRRPRAKRILEDTAAILGARSVEWFAGGGNSGGKKKPKPHNLGHDDSPDDPDAEARAQRKEQREQEAADLAARRADEADQRQRRADQLQEDQAKDVADRMEAFLDGQTRAWDMLTNSAQANVDAAEDVLAGVKANMDELGQAATAAFRNGWFEQTAQRHGLWAGDNANGVGDWRSKANQDISGLQERAGLITQLSDPSLGLSGDALKELLGDQDNAGIAAMLAAGEVDDYAAMFKQYDELLGGVSQQAGMAGHGTEWTEANSQFTAMNDHLARLTELIAAARPITVLEAVSAAATAAEIARLQANYY